MKVIKDYLVVRAELEKRGLWEMFAGKNQHSNGS
jgi:hypothetical protein